LVEAQATDTSGNAERLPQALEGLTGSTTRPCALLLVTSPYHLQRAAVTFNGIYRGSGIQLIASAAPDSDWRKRSWWLRPDLRRLTITELEKLGYIALTGRYN